jgi:hypothetical protein
MHSPVGLHSPPDLGDDDSFDDKNKNKRGVLPKAATQVMKKWLFQHIMVRSACVSLSSFSHVSFSDISASISN